MLRDTSGQDKIIIRSSNKKRYWLMGVTSVIAVVAVASVALPAFSSLFSSDMTVAKERLRFAEVVRGDMQSDIAVQGKIVAANSPTLYARSSGVVTLKIKAGDSVNKGQLLASIESPELNNRYSQQLAVLEQQKIEVGRYKIQMKTQSLDNQQSIEVSAVNLEAAEVNLRRAKISIGSELISQREFEEKQADYKRAELTHKHALENFSLQKESMEFELKSKQSQLARQQFVVDDLDRQVSELQLFAPADGIIGSINVREKDRVLENSALITLIDLSAFEVEVSIPENYADDLGVGLASEISFNGSQYPGQIIAISPEVNQGQVIGRIRFKNSDIKNLRQNQRVSARILIESRNNVLKVRRGAFVESGGGRIAYIVDGNIALKQTIQLGARSLSEVEVVSGLKAGDQIIISNLDNFNQQQQIYIAD